ncbi:MAG: lamin tail domain-containing protein, partial [Chloroflexi bacterium]|nr:lamin tail domain-containing protein [Chloroflexota bacterium]
VINEVQYDPPQTGVESAFEWVELFNRTSRTVDLTDWRIGDNYETDPIPSLTLPPGGFAVVAARADFYTNFPSFSGNIVFLNDGSIGNGLSNTGDRVNLVDPTGKIIDALSYGDDNTIMSPPCLDVAQGHSLERQPAGLDTNQAGDFVDNATPTPGYGLPSATPTPVHPPSPSPTTTTTSPFLSTPTPTAITPTPDFTPKLTPMPNLTTSPSASQAQPWIHTRIPAFLFLIGLTLFAAVFWLRRQG